MPFGLSKSTYLTAPRGRPDGVMRGYGMEAMDWSEGSCRRKYNLCLKVYQRDVKIVMSRERGEEGHSRIRGDIVRFSKRSSRRLLFLVRNTEGLFKTWIDLTYQGENFPKDGRVIKKQLDIFLKWLRRRGAKYLWRLEFQERGAPHFHLLVSSDFIHYREIAEEWDGIIGNDWKGRGEKHSASTKVGAISSQAQLYYRVAKYLGKVGQSEVPECFKKVGRFWGCTTGILKYELVGGRDEVTGKVVPLKVDYYDGCRKTRLFRRWLKARYRGRKSKWKYHGFGFVMYDGVIFLNYLRRYVDE